MAKLRGDLGEAAHDDADTRGGDDVRKGTLAAQMSGNNRGQPEDPAANDGVDHQRRKAPAAYGPHEVDGFAGAHAGRL